MDSVVMADNLATIRYPEIDRVAVHLTGANEIDIVAVNPRYRQIAAERRQRRTYEPS